MSFGREQLLRVISQGLEVSPADFFKDGDIEGLVCNEALKASVFLFELFEPLDLIDVKATVLLLPANQGLNGDSDSP
jgi:hypothetical protein